MLNILIIIVSYLSTYVYLITCITTFVATYLVMSSGIKLRCKPNFSEIYKFQIQNIYLRNIGTSIVANIY